jgi:hypothetical protein
MLLWGSASIWCADANIHPENAEGQQNALAQPPGAPPPVSSRLRQTAGRCYEAHCAPVLGSHEPYVRTCEITFCVGCVAGTIVGIVKFDAVARLLGLQND